MKLSCTQENLARGLALVSRVASKNVALPILNNVLIIAEDNQIRLQTTNLELAMSAVIRGKIETPGRYTVQSRLLADFVNFLEHEKITMESTPAGLRVESGHSQTTIKGLAAEEFPVLPSITDVNTLAVPSNELRRCLEGVVFAAANDESRPEISGIFLHVDGSTITAAATDSYRLAQRRCQALKATAAPTSVIMPSRAAHELLRILPTGPDEATIRLSETQVAIQIPEAEMVSRLIDGRYPEYQQIIPQQWKTRLTADRQELLNNIRAASLFCKPGINDLTLRVNVTNKTLVFQAANTQTGEHEAKMTVQVEGEDNDVVFNYRYLLDGLQSLTQPEVVFELTDAQAPGLLHHQNEAHELYLLMPIRQ